MRFERKISFQIVFAAFAGVALTVLFPVSVLAQSADSISLHRLYNQYSGEHFYTDSTGECQHLVDVGWTYEGIGWKSPVSSSVPVYRLYNPYVVGGDHHYTRSMDEYEALIEEGWIGEGVGWYSDENETVGVYREYNPNAFSCNHNFTTASSEHEKLISLGWQDESKYGSYAWYATEGGDPNNMELIVTKNRIMGDSLGTAAKMVDLYRSNGQEYPSAALVKGGAPTIEDFCQILCEEAATEGVRAEVVFAQAMLETGWLQFRGDVSIAQFNFAGIGATGNGAPGNSFKDVHEGLRAQVQHLKAYASTEPLRSPCVDPRFGYVERGCAPTVDLLAGKWAADANYGKKLSQIISEVL